MAYFRIQFQYAGKADSLFGVLSDYDGKVYFCADDIGRFVSKKENPWLKCRPLKDITCMPKHPVDMLMIALSDALDVLRFPKTPRSEYLVHLLEYGHVRDLPFNYPCHILTTCDSTEGIQFPTWLYIFQKDYGP